MMKITSPVFAYGQSIPKKYTCQGLDISPPLTILDVPPGTKSLALIMEDPDVPPHIREDGLWVHWVVYNIPPTQHEAYEGTSDWGQFGVNTSGACQYQGPCPPDRMHRYFFHVFALDRTFDFPQDKIITRDLLLSAMEGHILDRAELMGVYEQG